MNKSVHIKILLLLVVGCSAFAAQAQQRSLYTMYMWNQLILNPAYAGSRDAVSASAVSRHQWVGFDGAPSTQVVSVHSPLPNDNVGLGLTIENDRIGPTNTTGIWGDFAYRIQTTEKAKLSFGLRAGLAIYQADLRDINTIQQDDPAFIQNIENRMLPNFGLGVYYSSDRGYIGFASPTLMENELNGMTPGASETGLYNRHYYLMAGYVFNLSADSGGVMFKPSTVLRMVEGAPVSFDVSAMFLLKQKLWLGAAYRYQDSFAGVVSFQFTDHLQAGYSYDFGTSNLNNYHNGSHEIMLSYDFFKTEVKTKNPRYF